ncbi:MAG: VPLPA-CTERM sorting domain-containing protein [Paracoccaceae bacterium]
MTIERLADDADDMARIPLPASLPLLRAGLGGLLVMRRMTR